jgi:hypothetical protein
MAETRRQTERLPGGFDEIAAGGVAAAERTVDSAAAAAERASAETARQAERVVVEGRQGLQQATQAAETGAKAALRSGGTVADGVREIAQTWAHYAEEVMRHSSQAGQKLLRCRSWNEILEVQADLLRDNMHASLDQGAKLAEIGSRMATRPLDAMTEASGSKPR